MHVPAPGECLRRTKMISQLAVDAGRTEAEKPVFAWSPDMGAGPEEGAADMEASMEAAALAASSEPGPAGCGWASAGCAAGEAAAPPDGAWPWAWAGSEAAEGTRGACRYLTRDQQRLWPMVVERLEKPACLQSPRYGSG